MLLKRFVSVAALVVVAACGGGGDDGQATTDVLAKYAGTFTAACDGHSISTVTLTRTGTNALSVSFHDVYYQGASCTGAVVGTADSPTFMALSYQSTSSAAVSGYPSSGGITTMSVDRVTATVTGGTPTLSGSGLQLIDGQMCFVYTGGNTCPSASPAGSTSQGGLSLNGSSLLVLSAITSGYELDSVYTK